jgi:streptogramin lyase
VTGSVDFFFGRKGDKVSHQEYDMTLFRPMIVLIAAAAFAADISPVNDLPNPYQTVTGWFQLPEGRKMGSSSAVDIDSKGHIWVAERCGANTCAGSTLDPILEFDKSGKLLKSFGAGMFIFPHGICIDKQDNIWITDGQGKNGIGHQAIKFSPDGKVLMRLGKAGVAGSGEGEFIAPNDVAIAPNGDIFVAEGHSSGGRVPTNDRIQKFDKNGKFIKMWGKSGTGPGEFDQPHSLAFDSKGRLFVADRNNNRVQIFDQDGNFILEWAQFSRPSGLFIDKHDILYSADSESGSVSRNHPGWKRGIRIGSAKDGKVIAFIPDPDENARGTSAAEGVAASTDGVIYGAEVGPKDVKKYVKK